jgi:hypothetical protein
MNAIFVSETYQNYENGAVSNQLMNFGRCGICVWSEIN